MSVGRWAARLGFCLSLVSPAVAASLYEHPLLEGGGVPSTQADFPQKLSDFINQNGAGNTAEALLTSYFGPTRRNGFIPDIVVAYGKGHKDPVMALLYKGQRVD